MTHVRGRRVYLSGPMTGIEGWNRAAFDEAEKRLRELGASYEMFNPASDIDELSNGTHEQSMLYTVGMLVSTDWIEADNLLVTSPFYDLLVSLPGWEKSAGARLEREVAVACGIEVCDLDEVVE